MDFHKKLSRLVRCYEIGAISSLDLEYRILDYIKMLRTRSIRYWKACPATRMKRFVRPLRGPVKPFGSSPNRSEISARSAAPLPSKRGPA